MHFATPLRFLGRLRYELLFGTLVAVFLPPLLYHAGNITKALHTSATVHTTAGTTLAFIIALFLFRRVISFPGVGLLSHVLPAALAGYGLILGGFLVLRLPYSGAMLLLSMAACMSFLFTVSMSLRTGAGRRFYVVPSQRTNTFPQAQSFEWVILNSPELPDDPNLVLIADLRAELGPKWEKLITDAAVAGRPVYHIKQIKESLTGRVEIEHLSENSFGSLIPNLSYRKLKRAVDLLAALVALPLLAPFALVMAVLIKLDSPGPVFFRQERRGYRGEVFEVIKFRTMTYLPAPASADREHAITQADDKRITRLGRFLRRTRIDELPQIWNVLKGEMSWIGPRPEALALSNWYAAELPFYHYRHIVRPGITGWAQVNQGHVAELEEVFEKLHYDFYYIKNFSAWLDLLILTRTIATVFSGFGAK